MNRTIDWSFEVKEFREDLRRLSGWATTPDVDRVGDIVNPMGVTFKGTVPLLLNHDSRQPVGEVRLGKPTPKGVPFEAEIKRIDEPGRVKERLDEAWQSVKLGLIKGVSIGFRVLNDAVEVIKETGGLRFNETEVMELSLVAIPANASASILSFKQASPEQSRAASGDNAMAPGEIRLSSLPDVSGKTAVPKTKGKTMKMSIAEQLSAFEAKRQQSDARLTEITEKSAEDARVFNDTEKQEYDGLEADIKEIDEHIVRLKRLEQRAKETAKPAEEVKADNLPARVPAGQIRVKGNLPPGVGFARFAQAMYRAGGNHQEAIAIIKATPFWKDTEQGLVELCQKAAVPAADSTTAGWASELAYAADLQAEFIEYLRPRTIIGQIDTWRRIPFNVRMASLTAGLTGYWVGQGKPIPVSKGTTSSTSLGITKVAGLSAFDDEIMRLSSPSIDALVRTQLSEACIAIIDTSLIDPNQGGQTNIQPASLTYNVTPTSASGTNYAAFSTDIQALLDTILDVDVDPQGAVLVMPPQRALALSMMVTSLGVRQLNDISMNGGMVFGMKVVVSRYAGAITGSPNFGDMIILIHPGEVFLADDGNVMIEASREASLELLDNPTNLSTGATAATSMVSMFQTNSTAVKAVRFVNWAKRRSVAVQYIRNALYA